MIERRRRLAAVGLVLGLLVIGLLWQHGEAPAQGKGGLDPDGQPKQFDKGKIDGYAVWHGKRGWHLRTTTDKKKHHFKGSIQVEGGTITQIVSHHLEKEGKLQDHWRLAKKRHEVLFDFNTDEGVDGIIFQVSKDAKRIRFDLHYDGKEAPKRVFVGRDGEHPKAIPFTLPAHPGKK